MKYLFLLLLVFSITTIYDYDSNSYKSYDIKSYSKNNYTVYSYQTNSYSNYTLR